MFDWAALAAYLFWISILLSIGGLFLLPLLIIKIPADYFSDQTKEFGVSKVDHPVFRVLILVVRNSLASVLFIAGILMLFTPGQGFLTLLVALCLATFPGKRKLERKIIALPGVSKSINRLRTKAGKEPLADF